MQNTSYIRRKFAVRIAESTDLSRTLAMSPEYLTDIIDFDITETGTKIVAELRSEGVLGQSNIRSLS